MRTRTLPSPLLQRTSLLPDESLPSLLARLTRLNYYDAPTLLQHLCCEGLGSREHLGRPSNVATFERLAALTAIDSGTLYAASAHRFAPLLTPPDIEVESVTLPGSQAVPLLTQRLAIRHLRPESAAQFCPDCLKESPYHRLTWMATAISACLKHGCLLVEVCPQCRAKVSVQAIAGGKCGRCEANLASARSMQVREDAFGLFSQSVIQMWAGGASKPDDLWLGVLPQQPPSVLYHLVDGLRIVISSVGTHWEYLHQMPEDPQVLSLHDLATKPTPAHRYRSYATAFKAIISWPRYFFEFLGEYSLRGGRECRTGSLYQDLGGLYRKWLEQIWKHPAFEFVQKAFEEYLVGEYAPSLSLMRLGSYHHDPALSGTSGYITLAEAARLLRVSSGTIRRLVKIDRLAGYQPDEARPSRRKLVQRDQVSEMWQEWSHAISLEEAVSWLGVSKDVALDMVKVGLLVAESGPDLDEANGWLFSRQAVVECLENVRVHLGRYSIASERVVDLGTAARMLSIVGLSAAGVLKRMVDGKLYGYCSRRNVSDLSEVTFVESDIQRTLERIRVENG
jgi:excisionase family DNA binding protein